ncbi:MAG TPA: PQQ-binding-like beta-propeller repeat protein [Ktedonobacteraceae bacterium]|nr:PQQ-binding-like beta-propeller repeat protein [Ktedonobacteraceae bacterium]
MQRLTSERSTRGWIFASVFVLLMGMLSSGIGNSAVYAAGGNWPTYQFSSRRSGFNQADTILNPSSATHLKLYWTHTTSGAISAQPVVANSMLYWGSWSGLENATDLNNNDVWASNLGTTTDNSCYPSQVGVSSTATVATIGGNSTLFVGGGNAKFYALDAVTGTILWSTRLGSSPSHFLWSSPALFNGSIYEGVASFGDCPLVQGQVMQLNAATGAIMHIFSTVPAGCTGGGVSGSVAIDAAAGTLYFATGNSGYCGKPEHHSPAIVELNASNLSLVDAWEIPPAQQTSDGDFISTPTLFNSGGKLMVGVANKNGIFYAFQRDALSSGPVWQDQIAVGGDCPQCGYGSISPAGWDGTTLYAAGGNTTIRSKQCQGSLRAINPGNGAFLWQRCFNSGPVLAPVVGVPGVLVVGEGTDLVVLAAASGTTLYRFNDTNSGSLFYGGASIANGVIYIGNMDGYLYAIGT